MAVWADAMNKLGFFHKALKDLSEPRMAEKAYDFTLLKSIGKEAKQSGERR
jgi:hypothetical protein